MPVERDKDGNIIETPVTDVQIGKTQRTLSGSTGDAPSATETTDVFGQKTQIVGAGAEQPPTKTKREGDVDPAGGSATQPHASAAPGSGDGAPRTSLIGSLETETENEDDATQNGDPVVGWLVVENGPGRGSAMQVGMGMNPVGRGADQRISLNFGDNSISSEKHFFVSFDPRSNEFAVHRGDGTNLTYLNKKPIYGSEALSNMAQIEVGQTTLRFVALCGADFSWDTQV